MTERTFSIIKPDAVKRHLIGAILGRFEAQGFRVVALKMVQLTKEQAEGFYAEHQGKPFLSRWWSICSLDRWWFLCWKKKMP